VKPTINLRPIFHRDSEQIGIYFKNDLPLNIIVRKDAGAIWSQSKKCWYVPLSKKAFEKLRTAVKDSAILETSELKKFLEERDQKIIYKKELPLKKISPVGRPPQLLSTISPVNKHVLPAMKQLLKLKAFSPSTIKTYLNEMAQLLQTIKDIPADELKPEHLKKYLVYCYEKLDKCH
jgi:integrase/recombinase XerD